MLSERHPTYLSRNSSESQAQASIPTWGKDFEVMIHPTAARRAPKR